MTHFHKTKKIVEKLIIALGIACYALTPVIGVIVANSETITNTATISSSVNDPVETNNTASIENTLEDITDISVEEDLQLINNNKNIIITLKINNNTSVTAKNSVLNYALPKSFQLTKATIKGLEITDTSSLDLKNINLESLTPNSEISIILEASINPELSGLIEYETLATVSTTTEEITLVNNQDKNSNRIEPKPVDLSITKSNKGFVLNNNLIDYTLAITNNTNAEARNVTITDEILYSKTIKYQGLEFTRAPQKTSINGNKFSVTFDILNPSEKVIVTYSVLLEDPENTPLFNTAKVTTSTPETDSTNNISKSEIQVFVVGKIVGALPRTGGVGQIGLILFSFTAAALYILAQKGSKESR